MSACGNETADKDTASKPTHTQAAQSALLAADSQNAAHQLFPPGVAATSLSANLNGSGSTLISPALKIWQQEFGKLAPRVRINYQAGGSGQGRTDVLTGKTDFGVSDVQLTKDEASKTGHKFEDYLQIPATLAAIVLIYNVPGVPELKLDPQVLGKSTPAVSKNGTIRKSSEITLARLCLMSRLNSLSGLTAVGRQKFLPPICQR
jgi:ABC-type phosphate transport system substrate-binding protein